MTGIMGHAQRKIETDMPQAERSAEPAAPAETRGPKRAADLAAESVAPLRKVPGRYHHGNLKAALVHHAGTILEADGLEGLSLRAVARAAGVSQTAPYRHFADREALLAAVAAGGFSELAETIEAGAQAAAHDPEEAVVAIGGAYIRFATAHPARFRLMFGRDITRRREHAALMDATEGVAERIGQILKNPALGLGMWATMHGLAFLLVEDVADLGQHEGGATGRGLGLLPSRAEIVLRSLLAHLVEAE